MMDRMSHLMKQDDDVIKPSITIHENERRFRFRERLTKSAVRLVRTWRQIQIPRVLDRAKQPLKIRVEPREDGGGPIDENLV